MATATTSNGNNATAVVEDDGDCSCPICLETMNLSEYKIYPLPCHRCDFNFCSNCVGNFCKAAEDDFQMASDGSRQVKIHVSCPQCRSKYPLDDLEETVLLLRSAHTLANAIMIKVESVVDSDNDDSDTDNGNGDSIGDSDDVSGEETKEDPNATNTNTNSTATATTTTTTTAHTEYKLERDSDLSASQLARKFEFAMGDVRNRLEGASLLYEQAVAKALPQRKDVNEYTKTRAKTRRDAARAMRLALLDQLA